MKITKYLKDDERIIFRINNIQLISQISLSGLCLPRSEVVYDDNVQYAGRSQYHAKVIVVNQFYDAQPHRGYRNMALRIPPLNRN